jgi:hypothetical protein
MCQVSLIVFVMTFGSKADLFIMETVEPESSNTCKSRLLLTMPIVSEVQMVTGHSCFGKTIFGPW